MRIRSLPALLTALIVSFAAAPSRADGPYVVLQDDGTVEKSAFMSLADEKSVQKKVLALYDAAGQPNPDILSVWTTFPLGASSVSTYFDGLSNDVKGIGLDQQYPGDGTFKSPRPPLRSILFHNNVLALAMRAGVQKAPLDGFATYLFLLELTHNWGPQLAVPTPSPDALVGSAFPFHWSYWMDAGGSPAGGNKWKDNNDGTFTTLPQTPANVRYSMLDLYVMGLAAAKEVPPFGVLENVVPPAGVTDPLWGGAYDTHSFPWFGATPMTVKATRRMLTIDDVIAANGKRDPAVGASKTSWKLGIVLFVSHKDSDASIASAKQVFDPIAGSLAPAFATATQGRGSLEVVTPVGVDAGTGNDAGGGSGGAGGGSAADAGMGGSAGKGSVASAAKGCGCRVAGKGTPGTAALVVAMAVMGAAARRRRRAR